MAKREKRKTNTRGKCALRGVLGGQRQITGEGETGKRRKNREGADRKRGMLPPRSNIIGLFDGGGERRLLDRAQFEPPAAGPPPRANERPRMYSSSYIRRRRTRAALCRDLYAPRILSPPSSFSAAPPYNNVRIYLRSCGQFCARFASISSLQLISAVRLLFRVHVYVAIINSRCGSSGFERSKT